MALARIVVVGGFAMELAFWASRRPAPNETVYGTAFSMCPSGKGFTQAVAASRAEGKVVAVGRIGQDDFGDIFLRKLVAEGIETRWLVRDPANGTAVNSPLFTEDGREGIVSVPRANAALSSEDISRATQVLANSDVVLLQMEVPLEVSQLAAALGHSGGAKVIVNLAPYPGRDLPNELLALVDVLVMSERVAARLAGGAQDQASPESTAHALRTRGARRVVVTRGAEGCLLVDRDGTRAVPAFPVDAVNPSTAGDAFCGALAVAVAERQPTARALRFANAAAALACAVPGAEAALPTRYAIERLLRKQME